MSNFQSNLRLVFLDTVSASLLLDHFIDQQEWEFAIKVAWELYLQDDTRTFFSTPITLALRLYVAQKRIQCLWPNENENSKVIMDSDDVSCLNSEYIWPGIITYVVTDIACIKFLLMMQVCSEFSVLSSV
ncbi:unnamed protein product [Dicrocoelium dendriticum]|nr:unnamed protein product [Dicrocoelium dendriticum]